MDAQVKKAWQLNIGDMSAGRARRAYHWFQQWTDTDKMVYTPCNRLVNPGFAIPAEYKRGDSYCLICTKAAYNEAVEAQRVKAKVKEVDTGNAETPDGATGSVLPDGELPLLYPGSVANDRQQLRLVVQAIEGGVEPDRPSTQVVD